MVGALVGFGHCTRLLGSRPWEVIGFTHTMAEHLAACPQMQEEACPAERRPRLWILSAEREFG
jgi:hypothetical protein